MLAPYAQRICCRSMLHSSLMKIRVRYPNTAPRLAIGGRAIMRELGLREGPEVGRWLARARRRVTENPEENEPAKLLAWLRVGAGESGE